MTTCIGKVSTQQRKGCDEWDPCGVLRTLDEAQRSLTNAAWVLLGTFKVIYLKGVCIFQWPSLKEWTWIMLVVSAVRTNAFTTTTFSSLRWYLNWKLVKKQNKVFYGGRKCRWWQLNDCLYVLSFSTNFIVVRYGDSDVGLPIVVLMSIVSYKYLYQKIIIYFAYAKSCGSEDEAQKHIIYRKSRVD